MRKPIIAGNWKMNHTLTEGKELVSELVSRSSNLPHIDIVLCPPSLTIESAVTLTKESSINIGGQNCHPEANGAFTGEVSAPLLKAAGCTYCIVGHSERRQIFHESNDFINKKVHALLQENVIPILCCGETEDQREQNETFAVIKQQLELGLKDLNCTPNQLIIAYEPIWAIGTGKVATPEQAQDVHAFIRAYITERFSAQFAQALRIQYGGSVKPDNIHTLINQADIDGALVGGACLKADSFMGILEHSQSYAAG